MEFHRLPFEFNGTNLEINANCRDITLSVRVVGEPKEQTGLGRESGSWSCVGCAATDLANTRVTDKEELEKIIVFTCVHCGMKTREEGKTSATWCRMSLRGKGCVNNQGRPQSCTWPWSLYFPRSYWLLTCLHSASSTFTEATTDV